MKTFRIILIMLIVNTIFFSGCYTTKECVVEGSYLRNKENYDDIKIVTLKDSSVIRFGEKEQNHDVMYLNKYNNLNDIILYVSKFDTAGINDKIHPINKYHYLELKNVIKAKITNRTINPILTAGVIIGSVAAFCAILFLIGFNHWISHHLEGSD